MIVLDLPATKATAQGSKPFNVQKGPTCWYYAARLVREFHGRTFGWVKAYTSSTFFTSTEAAEQAARQGLTLEDVVRHRKVEKSVSDVRKLETLTSRALENRDTAPEKEFLDSLREVVAGYNPEMGAQWDTLVSGFYKGTPREGNDLLARFVKMVARAALADGIRDQLPHGVRVDDDDALYQLYGMSFVDLPDGVNALATHIRSFGPLVAGGQYAHDTGDRTEHPTDFVLHEKTFRQTFRLVRQPTRLSAGLHAIVLCGVIGSDVYYHDPNDPALLFRMPFTTLRQRAETNPRLWYLPCGGACAHVRDRRIYGEA